VENVVAPRAQGRREGGMEGGMDRCTVGVKVQFTQRVKYSHSPSKQSRHKRNPEIQFKAI